MSDFVEIVVKAVNQASTTLKAVDKDIDKLGVTSKTASKSTQLLNTNMAGLAVAGGVALGVTAALGKEVLDAANETVNYAREVRELSQITGMAAEESSRLIQVADDWQISSQELTAALGMMTKNGVEPSVEALADLADEYVNTSDKTKFAEKATKLFGRQWQTLVPLFAEGGDSLREQADAISESLIVTEEGIEAARDYEVAVDNLNDSMQGLKYTIGKEVVPTLATMTAGITDSIDKAIASNILTNKLQKAYELHAITMDEVVEIFDKYNKAGEDYNAIAKEMIAVDAALSDGREGSLLGLEALIYSTKAVTREVDLLAIAQASLTAGLRGQLTQATTEYDDTLDELGGEMEEIILQLIEAKKKYGEDSDEVRTLTGALEANKTKQLEAKEAMALATKEMIFQHAAAGLNAESALALARAMGLISEADAAVISASELLKDFYDKNNDQVIDAAEAAAGYTDEQLLLTDAVLALQATGLPITYETINAKILELKGITKDATTEMTTMGTTTPPKIDAVGREFDNLEHRAWVAAGKVQEVQEKLDRLRSRTITVNVNTIYTGNFPQAYLESEHGGQFGLDMVVPPGHPNDSFPVFATSGERVRIIPKGHPGNETRITPKIVTETPTTGSVKSGDFVWTGDLVIVPPSGVNEQAIAEMVMQRLSEAARRASLAGAGYAGR